VTFKTLFDALIKYLANEYNLNYLKNITQKYQFFESFKGIKSEITSRRAGISFFPPNYVFRAKAKAWTRLCRMTSY